MLSLDEDLSPFYEAAATDPDLAWVTTGAGRMIRSPTVFEEVVKTICTTNRAWSATVRMVSALVDDLGEPAPGGRGLGRAFPTPEAMAAKNERVLQGDCRAGYRGPYLPGSPSPSRRGRLDLEALGSTSAEELPDEEVEASCWRYRASARTRRRTR